MGSKDSSSISKRVQPSFSSRTLCHPSFMSLYTNPGVTRCCGYNQTVHPMIPQEFFYSDPNLSGTRIPNHVRGLKDFDCFQLNTPRPVMSACVAPTNRPDPFRTRQHFTRDLGSSSRETGAALPPVNRMWVVLQLTEEEDQTITNLLKLHHSEGKEELLTGEEHSPNPCLLNSREDGLGTLRKQWSDAELEVANTLLTQFGATDFPLHERELSTSEGDALCGLLNLGLAET